MICKTWQMASSLLGSWEATPGDKKLLCVGQGGGTNNPKMESHGEERTGGIGVWGLPLGPSPHPERIWLELRNIMFDFLPPRSVKMNWKYPGGLRLSHPNHVLRGCS